MLWPSLQRNFLLSLAAEGIYRVTWSEVILDELQYETERKYLQSTEQRILEAPEYALRLRAEMEKSFPDAMVYGWEALEGSFGLPDTNDEHVLAAAVLAQAGVIVSSNLKDFPQELLPGALVAVSPQVFVEDSVDLAPAGVMRALNRMSERSGRYGPVQTPLEIAQELSKRYDMECVVTLYS